jgi:hypothetical protein
MSIQTFQLQTSLTPESLCVCTSSGAIPISRGLVILNSPSAGLSMTLAAPIAGQPSAGMGGMDGQELRIIVVASEPLTSQVFAYRHLPYRCDQRYLLHHDL